MSKSFVSYNQYLEWIYCHFQKVIIHVYHNQIVFFFLIIFIRFVLYIITLSIHIFFCPSCYFRSRLNIPPSAPRSLDTKVTTVHRSPNFESFFYTILLSGAFLHVYRNRIHFTHTVPLSQSRTWLGSAICRWKLPNRWEDGNQKW